MKKAILVFFLTAFAMAVFAQETETPEEKKTGGFQKDKLFTGGDLTISFYTGGFGFGISPFFGYSPTKWLDAAVSMNFIYFGQTDIYGNKYRQTNVGPGAFVRLFPLDFIYAQVQFEHNFITNKFIAPGGVTVSDYTADVNSLLLGLGYTSGRSKQNNTYFYFAVMFDVLQLPNSPYVDSYGRLIPVIRAGYNIALFQGR